MDPVRVRAEARSRGVEGGDVHAWVASLEAACARAPGDRRLADLLLALDEEARLVEGTPPVVAGVRRQDLVRFDDRSATWTGIDLSEGAAVLVRAPRPTASPVARRVLARELARVAPAVGGRLVGGACVVPLPGWPAAAARGAALPRAVAGALGELRRWRDQVGADPEVADAELRATPDGRVVLCALTSGDEDATGPILERLVDPEDPDEIAVALRAVAQTGGGPDEAEAALRARMAAELVARRLELAGRWRSGAHRWSVGRLLHAVRRLDGAMPRPQGRGAVGVDLDGGIVVVTSTPGEVRFAEERVWDEADGLRPQAARRLLRLRAAAMPNPVLDARIGGEPGLTDAVCRWVAAALQLRTTRMLLEQELA